MNNGDERRAIDGLTTSDDGRTGRTRRFGFGGYSGGVSLRDASASGEVSSEVLDEDVARALRRCAQKSSTSTKVKALRELEESLFDGDEDDGAGTILDALFLPTPVLAPPQIAVADHQPLYRLRKGH